MIRFAVKNLHEFQRDLEHADKVRKKAAYDAVRLEGYRLSNVLKNEIKAGAPGGRSFKPVSEIAAKFNRSRKPLRNLHRAVRYAADMYGGQYVVSVGFTGSKKAPLSKSWYRIAVKQQEGVAFGAEKHKFIRGQFAAGNPTIKRWLRLEGAKIGKRSKAHKYFFLRKSTTSLKLPARPIIEPFWGSHRSEAERNIRYAFDRKLSGDWVKIQGTRYVTE